jgi:DNA-binding IclR family transcriptional regulator
MFRLMESGILVKAFGLLETMADGQGWRTLGELAATNGLAKPTCHRVLQCLLGLGYVEKSEPGVYRLTGKMRQLVLGVDERRLVSLAAPVLKKLHEKTEETVNLGVLRGERIVYLQVLETTHALRRVVEVHSSDPFFSTSLGRSIVAYESPQRREFLVGHVLMEKRTPKTVVDREEIGRILKRVREDGCAIEHDQNDMGVTCIGVPVFCGAEVVAAISISAPTVRADRATEALWVRMVRESAARITAMLNQSEKVTA